MRLSPGDQVDRYVLEKQLGEGGQGEVWRARDPLSEGTTRALKLVRVASTGAAQLERVRREARQLVQLQHPSLVECVSMFEDLRRELLGIVMEFVDAQPLDELIGDPRFDERTRLHLLTHVAQALAYVHQRDVVHRDVKLENVLVTRGFWAHPDDPVTVKLIDFGIAVQAANPSPLTLAGHIIGTPPYLAPELLSPGQWGGSSGASAPADVFAFGILAWKLLAGDVEAHPTELPPRARLEEYAAAYWRAKAGPWPGTPRQATSRWTKLLERALALHPRDRARDGLDLLKAVAVVDPDLVIRTAEETAPTPLLGSAAIESRQAVGFTEPQTVNVNVTPRPAVRTIPGGPPNISSGSGALPGPVARRSNRWVWVVLAGLCGGGFAIIAFAATVLVVLGSGEPAAPATPADSRSLPKRPTATDPSGGEPRDMTGAQQGDLLSADSEWLLRVNGAVLMRASPTSKAEPSSFPEDRSERLCIQVRRTGESCCINFGATGCSVPIRVGDLLRAGMGLSAVFYRDGNVILTLNDVRFPASSLRYTEKGYALPLKEATVAPGGEPAPWGNRGWPASINGFLDRK
ncbi:MAG: serine/threonine protein kinase [Myxococcales bacterium]|nr:serine/threonine protein kinase [Myxococcales bacterium]